MAGGTPTGTVTFTVWSGNTTCSGTGTAAGTVPLDAAGVAHPSSDETVSAGGLSFKAHYNGSTTYNESDSACEPLTATGIRGKTAGFWRNKNGHKILDAFAPFGFLDTPVFIGGSTRGFTVTTVLQSDTILGNGACGPSIFNCGSNLSPGLNTNTLEVLAAQTLALTYNINNISGFSSNTIGSLGCTAPSGLGLTSSSTMSQVLVVANSLIDGSTSAGTTTQAQAGAMNSLLGGCVNIEA